MARLIGLRVFLTACIVVFLGIAFYTAFKPTGLPFIPTFIDATTARVDPVGGIALPQGLKAGDLIDLSATPPESRAVLYTYSVTSSRSTAAGFDYGLAVRRGSALVTVPVSTMDLSGEEGEVRIGIWTVLYEVMVFTIVALLALWQGRDRTAWFICIWGFVYVAGNALNALPVASYAIYAKSVLAYIGFFAGRVALYGAAEALAGEALTATARWVLRTVLAVTVTLGLTVFYGGMWFLAHDGSAAWLNAGYNWLIAVPYLVSEAALLMALQRTTGANRLRIQWLLWSLVPFIFGVFAGHVDIFGYLGTGVLNPLGIGIGGTGVLYAILRHRVVDVAVFLDRTLVYGATTSLVVGVLAAVNSLALRATLGEGAGLLLQVVVPLALGIVLGKLRIYMDKGVERVFFRSRYLAEKALKRFAKRAAHMEEVPKLIDAAVNEIRRHTRAPSVSFYEAVDKGYVRLRMAGEGTTPEQLDQDDPASAAVKAERKSIELAGLESRLGNEGTVFPIIVLGRLRGLVVLANRPGERYAADERKLLAQVVRDVGAAWRILRARDNEELVRALAQGRLKPAAARVRAKALEAAWAAA